jgi:hypothetical protein
MAAPEQQPVRRSRRRRRAPFAAQNGRRDGAHPPLRRLRPYERSEPTHVSTDRDGTPVVIGRGDTRRCLVHALRSKWDGEGSGRPPARGGGLPDSQRSC